MELIIPRASFVKMVRYTRAAEGEISGLADVDWDEQHKNLVVGDVYLLEQKATAGSVELFEEAVHKFMFESIKKGNTRTPRLWWHSHPDFSTFFSGTDESTIKKLRTDTLIVAICINRAGEMTAKAIISSPKEKVIDPLSVKIVPPDPLEPTEKIKEEVARKVTMEKFTFPFPKKIKQLGGFLNNVEDKRIPKRHIAMLPFKLSKALKTMESKRLIESFDPHFHEWVLEDPITKTIYRAQEGSPVEEWLNGPSYERKFLS